jgi:hypothetical protein
MLARHTKKVLQLSNAAQISCYFTAIARLDIQLHSLCNKQGVF